MSEINRRDVIGASAAIGAAAVAATLLQGETTEATAATTQLPPEAEARLVSQLGFTPQEANAWVITAELGNQLLTLPGLGEFDKQELTRVIQYVQTKLMSMPTNRRYGQLRGGQ